MDTANLSVNAVTQITGFSDPDDDDEDDGDDDDDDEEKEEEEEEDDQQHANGAGAEARLPRW